MTEEFGPPIAVNGKRPEWLGDYDWCEVWCKIDWLDADRAVNWDWPRISKMRLQSSHPYYQSAEYKAIKASDELYRVMQECSGATSQIGAGQSPMTEAEMIAALEATGHTVTPPDPLAADREFLAGLVGKLGWFTDEIHITDGKHDESIPAAMEYLRANKARL